MSINGIVTLPPAQTAAMPSPSALPPFGVNEIRKRTHAVQEVMRGVMKEGTHYGTIPGTPKPSLWKAGAEVLCMTFRLAPMLESRVTVDDAEGEWSYSSHRRDGTPVMGTCIGFFEVEATCTVHGPSGEPLSRCSSRCNNREAKYRSLSLFDVRNTVQKMAEKRAFVSAVLMATGASDIFTQDIEDFPDLVESPSPPTASSAKEDPEPREERLSPGTIVKSNLTPKQEAWLKRVAMESRISDRAVIRCLTMLENADRAEVRKFFDQLARVGGEALRPFLAE